MRLKLFLNEIKYWCPLLKTIEDYLKNQRNIPLRKNSILPNGYMAQANISLPDNFMKDMAASCGNFQYRKNQKDIYYIKYIQDVIIVDFTDKTGIEFSLRDDIIF